jgi:hypothetical protein
VEKRNGGFRRLAVLFAVASVGVLAVGAHAASAASIEICKSSANGNSGKIFTYHVNGGSSISVAGGRCSGAIQLAANTNTTITEDQSNPATDVASIVVRPSIWQVSQDLVGRSVVVNPGVSTGSGLATFTNQPAGGNFGTLKICKLTQTPAFLGRLFSFSANGGPIVSTEANDAFDDPANWSCRILGTFQVGSNVTVRETIPAGVEVNFIDSDPATALVDFNTTTGTGIYKIGAGVTVALFDDEPTPPSGTGTLEICKTAAELAPRYADPDVHGPFTFTAVDSAGASYGPFTINVPNPNNGLIYCTAPFTVAAGVATVTEGSSPGFDLVDVFTNPSDRFLTANLINHTASVEVPSSLDPNDETQVVFVNQTQRAQLKLCKALGPGSADLIGQVFNIDWSSSSGQSGTTAITAQAQIACVVVGNLPIGATVSLSEENPGQFIDSSGPSSITLASGMNAATFTNTARGLLEVCKTPVVGLATQPVFQFRVDGGGIINVRAGSCNPAIRVSVGSHTVSEVANANFDVTAINAIPASALASSSLANRTATVNVAYAQDVSVFFTNRIKVGNVKVCKFITPGSTDALNGKTFFFDVYVGSNAPARIAVTPGSCTFVTDRLGVPIDFPILQPNGSNTPVAVAEVNAATTGPPLGPPLGPPYNVLAPPPLGTYYVTGITVSGNKSGTTVETNCQSVTYSPTGQHCLLLTTAPAGVVHVRWSLGPNVNAVNFTNTAGDD